MNGPKLLSKKRLGWIASGYRTDKTEVRAMALQLIDTMNKLEEANSAIFFLISKKREQTTKLEAAEAQKTATPYSVADVHMMSEQLVRQGAQLAKVAELPRHSILTGGMVEVPHGQWVNIEDIQAITGVNNG